MSGEELIGDARTRHRRLQYRLVKAGDVATFIEALDVLHSLKFEFKRARHLNVTDMQTGTSESMALGQTDPSWNKHPLPVRRWVENWRKSSAGPSGARLLDHWKAQISDCTSPIGARYGSDPRLDISTPLAKIESRKGGDHELYGVLEKLDRRIKVPFTRYF